MQNWTTYLPSGRNITSIGNPASLTDLDVLEGGGGCDEVVGLRDGLGDRGGEGLLGRREFAAVAVRVRV